MCTSQSRCVRTDAEMKDGPACGSQAGPLLCLSGITNCSMPGAKLILGTE